MEFEPGAAHLKRPPGACRYYCILYAPAVVLRRLPVGSFAVYMAGMGVCGVLDHSGVRLGCVTTTHPLTPVYISYTTPLHRARW